MMSSFFHQIPEEWMGPNVHLHEHIMARISYVNIRVSNIVYYFY